MPKIEREMDRPRFDPTERSAELRAVSIVFCAASRCFLGLSR